MELALESAVLTAVAVRRRTDLCDILRNKHWGWKYLTYQTATRSGKSIDNIASNIYGPTPCTGILKARNHMCISCSEWRESESIQVPASVNGLISLILHLSPHWSFLFIFSPIDGYFFSFITAVIKWITRWMQIGKEWYKMEIDRGDTSGSLLV